MKVLNTAMTPAVIRNNPFNQPISPNTNVFGPANLSRLGRLFLTTLIAILALWLSLSLQNIIVALYHRDDFISGLMLALMIIAALAGGGLIVREITGVMRLAKLKNLSDQAETAYHNNDLKMAKRTFATVKNLYAGNPAHRWTLARLKDLQGEIMDGRETIELLDRELGQDLDRQASQIISQTAKKVSVITAIAPGPLIDMVAVTLLNLSMLRTIAALYGGRPGFMALIKLARQIVTHLALTGGLALTSDLLQPLIGHSLAAKTFQTIGRRPV